MSEKHHCTDAQGGFIFTRGKKLYWEAKRFSDRGKPFNSDENKNIIAGLNCNFTDLSSIIGSVQLKKLPKIVKKRIIIADKIRSD